MYNMCYKCQGFTGFLILVIISVIIMILTMLYLFIIDKEVGKKVTIDLHEKDQLKETIGIREGSKGDVVDIVTEDEITGEVVNP